MHRLAKKIIEANQKGWPDGGVINGVTVGSVRELVETMRELRRALDGAVQWLDSVDLHARFQPTNSGDVTLVDYMPNNVPGRDAMRETLRKAYDMVDDGTES